MNGPVGLALLIGVAPPSAKGHQPAVPGFSQTLLFGVITSMKVLVFVMGFSKIEAPQSIERWDLALNDQMRGSWGASLWMGLVVQPHGCWRWAPGSAGFGYRIINVELFLLADIS